MSDDVKCDVCGIHGIRKLRKVAPFGWYYGAAAVLDDANDELIVYACSEKCRDAFWKNGPGFHNHSTDMLVPSNACGRLTFTGARYSCARPTGHTGSCSTSGLVADPSDPNLIKWDEGCYERRLVTESQDLRQGSQGWGRERPSAYDLACAMHTLTPEEQAEVLRYLEGFK